MGIQREHTINSIENGTTNKITRVLLPGTDSAKCNANKVGCETFANGTWIPDTLCAGK